MRKGEGELLEQNVFASIIGYAEVKLELMRILDQLENPEKYAALGVTDCRSRCGIRSAACFCDCCAFRG